MTVVSLVYMVEVAGLDPLQMVLVGTALEFSAFVFEIPTGIFADTVSRKWSVVIGHALTGIAFVVLAMFPRFDVIILTQILWGFGWTFISGAYPAWLTEEIGVERLTGRCYVRRRFPSSPRFLESARASRWRRCPYSCPSRSVAVLVSVANSAYVF